MKNKNSEFKYGLSWKLKGVNWVTLCPFHKEKTPSMKRHKHKDFYHCFGCGASGKLSKLRKEVENMNRNNAKMRVYDLPTEGEKGDVPFGVFRELSYSEAFDEIEKADAILKESEDLDKFLQEDFPFSES